MGHAIAPLDLSWLLMESPSGTTHVGAMLWFKKPPDRRNVVREIVEAYRWQQPQPPFNYVPEVIGTKAPDAAMTYAVAIIAPAGAGVTTHLDRVTHPACNLVISNVPGAKEIRYLNGAPLAEHTLQAYADLKAAAKTTASSADGPRR
jgi:hypothetical protein